MQLNIPPSFFYVFGAILVALGTMRATYLGAPRTPRESVDEDDAPKDTAPSRGPAERRHLRWGIIYVLMGLFLIISTYVQAHRR